MRVIGFFCSQLIWIIFHLSSCFVILATCLTSGFLCSLPITWNMDVAKNTWGIKDTSFYYGGYSVTLVLFTFLFTWNTLTHCMTYSSFSKLIWRETSLLQDNWPLFPLKYITWTCFSNNSVTVFMCLLSLRDWKTYKENPISSSYKFLSLKPSKIFAENSLGRGHTFF